jgi:hypothetical protein
MRRLASTQLTPRERRLQKSINEYLPTHESVYVNTIKQQPCLEIYLSTINCPVHRDSHIENKSPPRCDTVSASTGGLI